MPNKSCTRNYFTTLVLVGGILIIALGCYLVLGISYLFLSGVNFAVTNFELIDVQPVEIGIYHLLVCSIFIMVAAGATANYSNDIKNAEKTLRDEIFSLHHTVEAISLKLNDQEELKDQLESICLAVEDLRE